MRESYCRACAERPTRPVMRATAKNGSNLPLLCHLHFDTECGLCFVGATHSSMLVLRFVTHCRLSAAVAKCLQTCCAGESRAVHDNVTSRASTRAPGPLHATFKLRATQRPARWLAQVWPCGLGCPAHFDSSRSCCSGRIRNGRNPGHCRFERQDDRKLDTALSTNGGERPLPSQGAGPRGSARSIVARHVFSLSTERTSGRVATEALRAL